jgi:hypothetical protein
VGGENASLGELFRELTPAGAFVADGEEKAYSPASRPGWFLIGLPGRRVVPGSTHLVRSDDMRRSRWVLTAATLVAVACGYLVRSQA